MIRRTKKLPGK